MGKKNIFTRLLSFIYSETRHFMNVSLLLQVNVDLSLTFRIGPDIDAARNFVYRLGAHRFDELLSAETEESIRGLVYSVTHDKVRYYLFVFLPSLFLPHVRGRKFRKKQIV